MRIAVTGLGWANGAGMGCGKEKSFVFGDSRLIPKISRRDVFSRPLPHFGRMDKYSRLGLAGIAFALRDASLDQWTKTRDIALIASTTFGCLNADEDYFDTVKMDGGRLASPNLFAYALPNTYLGEASILFGLSGAAFAVMETVLTGMSGMCITMGGIKSGEHRTVITGICDVGGPECLHSKDRVIPGAVFFVIQSMTPTMDFMYGELTQDISGKILFNGETVTHMNQLARMCTDRAHRSDT